MRVKRLRAVSAVAGGVLLVCVLLVSSLGGTATTASADAPAVQVTSVTSSPDSPVVGETVTMEATVSNLEGTNGTVEVTDVYLRDWPTEYERVENVGSVAPGGSVTVPVTTVFDTPGEKRVTVHVVVRDGAGDSNSYSYPLVVDVEEPDADGDLSVDRNASGETAVTLTNYGNVDFTDVEIAAMSGDERRARRHALDVAPGDDRTVTFDTEGDDVDDLAFVANYSANGETHEVRRALGETPDVRGDLSIAGSAPDRTTVSLENYGNVAFSDVEVAAVVDGEVRDRRYTRDVPADENRSAAFDTEGYDAGNVTFTASYAANGETHEVSREVALEPDVSGEIRLTAVEATRRAGSVSIDGEAANVGGSDAESVLVSVRGGDGVTPEGGSGEYFVGAVDASEFATFELAASVGNGTTEVPVEVSYLVDGERVTTVRPVEVSSTGFPPTGAATSEQSGGGPSGGSGGPQGPPGDSGLPTLPILVGVIALIGAAGGLYYLWNRE
ncbi:hypothetical protein SAMN04488066_102172 [Halorubrum aquaticum]|uniref:CARDB domain-containing protein n=1 Tax=Halorubrum aquaticum TaxID=387340 RepID=A0A1I2ZKB4_9EURY|nr:hypothetical protein [Halorubrum aquaticum]SFH37929.1 hypothetical protein SAMN04488066_102172 [Halorubrum aquaticum]